MSIEGYYREKLSNAVACLVGLGDIRVRLINAFLSMSTVIAEKFPTDELQDQFRSVHFRATRFPARNPDEGTIKATLDQIADEEAVELSRDILAIHDAMLRRAKDPYD